MSKNHAIFASSLKNGNWLYEQGRHCEALLSYNKCLCYGTPETQVISLSYGKRSVVYFDLNEYELCLANIELAEQNDLSVRPVNYHDLKAKCRQSITSHRRTVDEDPMNFFMLSYPANARLPCLSDCLELRVNEKFGRHIISTRSLKVGDIVAVTDFSFIFFDKRARLHHCSHCTRSDMKLNLIPCMGCAKAMYCSKECMTKDAKKFHQYECGIEDNPVDLLDYNPLKILLHILAQFDDDVNEMKTFLDANATPKCVFDFDLSNRNDPMFERNMILATLSMSHNMNCAEMGKDMCLTTHHQFIMKHPKLLELWSSPHREYLDNLLCKLLDVEDVKGLVSCFAEVDINLKESGYDGIYKKTDGSNTIGKFHANPVAFVNDPYLSLLNQSCFPNICVKFVNNKHAWIVIRPVEAGEQLFMFRGPGSQYITPRLQRQQMMLEHFGFKCDCDGCLNNWPTQPNMRKLLTTESLQISLETSLRLKHGIDENQPNEYVAYAEHATKLQAMSKYFPCQDALECQVEWMFNIYRLALPAQWVKSTDNVYDEVLI